MGQPKRVIKTTPEFKVDRTVVEGMLWLLLSKSNPKNKSAMSNKTSMLMITRLAKDAIF
jgi:hypothetical protein